MNRCTHKHITCLSPSANLLTKSAKHEEVEGFTAPAGSGLNLSQALARVADGEIEGDSEIWVRSSVHPLNPQMSAIISIGHSLIDELGSAWHLACLARNASELEVELWG